MPVGLLSLKLHLPHCHTLKAKRSQLAAILARLRKVFNIAIVEYDYLDAPQSSLLMISTVSNQTAHIQQIFSAIINDMETRFPEAQIIDETTEINPC